MNLPKANNANLVTRELDKELLIYNTLTNKAYTLNETSMIVFNACNGATTFDELKVKHQYSDEIIFLALDGLKKESLLADESYISPFAGTNRRDVIKKVGLASMIALPIICSLIAPAAVQAASSGSIATCQPCTQTSDCASGRCVPSSQNANTKICSLGTNNAAVARPGENIQTADFVCPTFGTAYCCSGGATFSAPSRCTCN